MCLAIPARVVDIGGDGARGKVSLGGAVVEVCLALLEEVSVGDYVLVHVGYAISRLDTEEAERTLELFEEIAALQERTG